jgi:hypothetical protein
MHRTTALLIALALAIPASASAASAPILVSTIADGAVDVAVTSDGTAHVAWGTAVDIPGEPPFTTTNGRANAIAYCKIPVGAKACAAAPVILLPEKANEGEWSNPTITALKNDDLAIVDSRCCGAARGTWLILSTDGGATWGTPHLAFQNDSGMTRPGTLAVINEKNSTLAAIGGYIFPGDLSTTPLDRPEKPLDPRLDITVDGTLRAGPSTLGVLPDGRLFVTAESQESAVRPVIRAMTSATADPLDPASWKAWTPLLGLWPAAVAQGGSSLSWLLGRDLSGFTGGPSVRSYDGTTASSATSLGGELSYVNGYRGGMALAVDPTGARHAVWLSHNEGCELRGFCLLYRRSASGAPFGPRLLLGRRDSTDQSQNPPIISNPRVDANRKGRVWAAFLESIPGTHWQSAYVTLVCNERADPDCDPSTRTVAGKKYDLVAPNNVFSTRTLKVSLNGTTSTVKSVRFDIARARMSDDICLNESYCVAAQIDGRRAVTDRAAPFSATFANLPWSNATSGPEYDNKCLLSYVTIRLTAVVKTTANKTVRLEQQLSYCPPQNPRKRPAWPVARAHR